MMMLRTSSSPRMWWIATIDIHHVNVALAILEMDVNVIFTHGCCSCICVMFKLNCHHVVP